jgi:peptidyl-prolyl cis-trans isomerase A (cyclophilin A)
MQLNKLQEILVLTSLTVGLAACGGGGGGAPAAETVAPVVTGVSVSNNSTQITFTAAATDNIGVTGYCFKTSSTTPLANDACFQASASSTVAMPQTGAMSVWAKDAAGNVSGTASAGCAASGVTASQASALPTVCVSTSLGQYVVEIESVNAPITAANFLRYVAEGYYNQTVFHRVISIFMVQGGGFTDVPINVGNIKAGTVYTPIVLETPAVTGVSNTLGSISMARTSVLDSATTQFFINVANNDFLDTQSGGYAAFGRVISGMNTTIERIRTLPVQSNGSENGSEISQPLTAPVIQWAYQLK